MQNILRRKSFQGLVKSEEVRGVGKEKGESFLTGALGGQWNPPLREQMSEGQEEVYGTSKGSCPGGSWEWKRLST